MPDPTLSRDTLFTQSLNHKNTKFLEADTTVAKTIFTAGVRGSIITAFTLSTDETAANSVILSEIDRGTSYHKDKIALASSTPYGTDGTNGELDILSMLEGIRNDGNGNKAYYLSPGKSLQAAMGTTIASTKTVTIKIQAEDF